MGDFKTDIVNDIADVVNTVADKVVKYGGIAKTQALIKAEEAKKQKVYYDLGKKYYELYKDAPASDLAEVTKQLADIDAKIAEYKEEIKAHEAAGYTDVTDDGEATQAAEAAEDAVTETVEEVAEETAEEA